MDLLALGQTPGPASPAERLPGLARVALMALRPLIPFENANSMPEKDCLDEAARLMVAAAQERQAEHLVDFITLGLHTGMRSGELLGLGWRRVDWRQAVIRLDAGDQKNGKAGCVPLNQTAREARLTRARWRATHCPASPGVFCNRAGERIASIKKSFAAAVKRAGIPHCNAA